MTVADVCAVDATSSEFKAAMASSLAASIGVSAGKVAIVGVVTSCGERRLTASEGGTLQVAYEITLPATTLQDAQAAASTVQAQLEEVSASSAHAENFAASIGDACSDAGFAVEVQSVAVATPTVTVVMPEEMPSPSERAEDESDEESPVAIYVGVSVAAVVLLLLGCACVLLWRRRSPKSSSTSSSRSKWSFPSEEMPQQALAEEAPQTSKNLFL